MYRHVQNMYSVCTVYVQQKLMNHEVKQIQLERNLKAVSRNWNSSKPEVELRQQQKHFHQ